MKLRDKKKLLKLIKQYKANNILFQNSQFNVDKQVQSLLNDVKKMIQKMLKPYLKILRMNFSVYETQSGFDLNPYNWQVDDTGDKVRNLVGIGPDNKRKPLIPLLNSLYVEIHTQKEYLFVFYPQGNGKTKTIKCRLLSDSFKKTKNEVVRGVKETCENILKLMKGCTGTV